MGIYISYQVKSYYYDNKYGNTINLPWRYTSLDFGYEPKQVKILKRESFLETNLFVFRGSDNDVFFAHLLQKNICDDIFLNKVTL